MELRRNAKLPIDRRVACLKAERRRSGDIPIDRSENFHRDIPLDRSEKIASDRSEFTLVIDIVALTAPPQGEAPVPKTPESDVTWRILEGSEVIKLEALSCGGGGIEGCV